MISINLNNIAISNILGVDYHCIIIGISKYEAINLLQSADLSKTLQHYKINSSFIVYRIWVKKLELLI